MNCKMTMYAINNNIRLLCVFPIIVFSPFLSMVYQAHPITWHRDWRDLIRRTPYLRDRNFPIRAILARYSWYRLLELGFLATLRFSPDIFCFFVTIYGSFVFEPADIIPSSYETDVRCAIPGPDAKVARILNNTKGGPDYAPISTSFPSWMKYEPKSKEAL